MNTNGGTGKGIYNPENIDHFKFVLIKKIKMIQL